MNRKPCIIQVTAINSRGESFSPQAVRGRYRSIRNARENILDAVSRMSAHSSCSYRIEIVTEAGEVIPVRESVVDYVERWNREETYTNSIGARLRRGEAVAC